MTAELGMNLAGVERVFELEDELERMNRRMAAMERRARELEGEMEQELERVRKQFRAEIVPYGQGRDLIPARDLDRLRIPVRRPRRRGSGDGRASA
jgi:MerR family transcriptional regulator/heat shock protein HspR